jgi:hypothetical protein
MLLLFFYIQFTIGIELLNIMRGDSMNPVLILRYSHLVIFKIFKESPFILMGFAPAFFVHLWLPLFAFGALSVRIIYPVFRFIEWAQWFLKQGNQHPLRAVGIVAAALVFMGAMICRAVSAIA